MEPIKYGKLRRKLAWCMRTSKRNAIELWITFWINQTDWQTDDSLLIFELPVSLILLTTKTNQNEKEITNNYDFCCDCTALN